MADRPQSRVTSAQYDAAARSGCFACRMLEGRPLFPNPPIVYQDEAVFAFLNQFPSQEGYTIVCPKRHIERYEADLSPEEWLHLMAVVQRIARAASDATGAIRMYMASLGSPERNPHIHIHVCPCPEGTRFDQQQFAAMQSEDGQYLALSDQCFDEIAEAIRRTLANG